MGSSSEELHVFENAPHHTHALTQLAACYMSMDCAERAEAPLNEALRHPQTMHQHGISAVCTTCTSTKLTTPFQTLAAVQCDGHHLDARLQIAAHHHGLGNMDEAETVWKAILSIDPDHQLAKTRLSEARKT